MTIHKKERVGIGQSDKLLASAMAQRIKPAEVLPQSLASGEHRVIPTSEFSMIDIDERYQRAKITSECNDIIVALRNGGSIGEDIHLALREYEDDGKLWVVDGQQRWWASYDVCRPFEAKIHKVKTLADEMLLFRVLNARVKLGPNTLVNAWAGPVADAVRKANLKPDHPLFGRVNVLRGGDKKIGAGVLVVGLQVLLTGVTSAANIRKTLAMCDIAMKNDTNAQHLVAGFLWLAGTIFADGYVPYLNIMALAQTARARWSTGQFKGLPQQPDQRSINALKRVNWHNVAPGHAIKWLPVVRDVVEKKWHR